MTRLRAANPARPQAEPPTAFDAVFWLLVAGVLLRCFLTGSQLDAVYPYSLPGGQPWMKIHPGSYVVFLAAALAAFRPTYPGSQGMVLPAVLLTALPAIGAAWVLVFGSTTSVAPLFDLYLVAAAGLFAVSRFDPRQRELLFHIVLGALAVNAVVLVAEFLLRRPLIDAAAPFYGDSFRPVAFLTHPLLNGLIYASIAPLMIRLRAPLWTRVLLSGLAAAVVLISGARFASIIAVAMLPVTLVLALRAEPNPTGARQWTVWLQLVVMATGLPLFVAGALAGGLGYRFANSLVDESALKRVNDLQLLNYISPHDWWFGGNLSLIGAWSFRLFNGSSIENPVVIGIFTYGLPVTLVLLALIALAFIALGLRSGGVERVALASFLIVACSNNALMTKGLSLMLVVVAVAAVGGGAVARTARLAPRWRTVRGSRPTPRWRRAGSPSPSLSALARNRPAAGGLAKP